jgi:hypothetical protein
MKFSFLKILLKKTGIEPTNKYSKSIDINKTNIVINVKILLLNENIKLKYLTEFL